ncbi:MAG: hypothetical protein JWN04_401 [Myxococcaceae bacterium]|nr:hypothetical protein [Myxococcaceae bacterium]
MVVGWDEAAPGFFLKCFGKNADGNGSTVSFWNSSLKTLEELEDTLLSINCEFAIPGVVRFYLAAQQAKDPGELRVFEPMVAGYRED